MASVPMHIANLLDKMTSIDKDFRFMATNDLMSELQKDSIKLDDDSERKVVKMLLKLLADKNGEVQNLAVKCLGPLVNKVKDTQVETIVDTLCNNMLAEKEQLRDISSIGLKTVINELAPANSSLVANICRKITSQLTGSVSKQDDVSVQLEILDILSDLLNRFGSLLTPFHANILQNLLPQLSSPRLAVRKRTIVATSYLANSCNNALFTELMNYLITQLEKNASLSTTRTYIQCLGAITRQAGHRVGEYLDRALPLITRYCNVRRTGPLSEGEDDDELRECCIQSLESFAKRCPKDVGPHLEKVINICLTFLIHDPNYSYGDDGDAMDIQSGDGEDDEDDDGDQTRSDSDFSDDDDVSWKVRRASAKCLAAIFSIRHDMLQEFYEVVSPALISRFKEREENVKADIFTAYIALLRQTRSTTSVTGEEEMDITDGPLSQLATQVSSIVGSVSKLLKEKSVKTKQGCFALLSELVQTLPGALKDHIHLIMPGLHNSLIDKNSTATMKIEALSFLNLLLTSHPSHVFRPHLGSLVPPVVLCMGDSFYKVASEALLVAQHLVKVLRPLDVDPPIKLNEKELSLLYNIFSASVARLTATDVDQEVKERAISCSAQLICQSVDLLGHERVSKCLPIIIVDRLRNETTRLAAARAFVAVASSPLRVDLSPELLSECVPLLGSFLRKNQRGLRLCSLQCLDALVRNGYATTINAQAFDATTADAALLVCDADLHLAQMALQFLASLCRAGRAKAVTEEGLVLTQVVELVKSPLLQGSALLAVIDTLVALLCAHENDPSSSGGGASIDVLFELLTRPVYEFVEQQPSFVSAASVGPSAAAPPAAVTLHKQAYHSIAKCVAALLVVRSACHGPNAVFEVVDNFLSSIKDPNVSRSVQLLAILGLGEIGRNLDLGDRCTSLQAALLECFGSSSDDVKQAAAVAIGAIAVGNLNAMLKFILAEIRSQPTKRQYLLLHSLKEVISSQQQQQQQQQQMLQSSKGTVAAPAPAAAPAAGSQQHCLTPYVKQIWNLLMKNCECQEEGTRNVVAECLGRLALLNVHELLPQLRACLSLPSPHARGTAIAAVKFVVSDQPQPYDNLLRQSIGDFLSALKDPDVGVRRVALVTFNSVAHNKPSLMRDLLHEVLPHLYSETKVRNELIREVEMGPFKHTVDDGLDIRKAAFECMYTLLDSCLDRINIFEFLTHVEDGLADHYDIKMLTYLMLIRLSHLCPVAILQRLDHIVEALRATCMSKVRATSVKQEFEKQDELKRSAMRAVGAILQISDADKNTQLSDFLAQIRQNTELSAVLDSVKENSNSPGTVETCLMDIS